MNFLDERWTAIPQGLDRANLYPYEAPRINFIINRGKIQKLPNKFKFDKRIPILAIGSNRSPSQLLRKFGKLEKSFMNLKFRTCLKRLPASRKEYIRT